MTRPANLVRAIALLLLGCAASAGLRAQSAAPVLDHVVAVVNSQAILASDVLDQLRLSVFEPGSGPLSPRAALDQLISQALIEQQIQRDLASSDEPIQKTALARLAEIRAALPACLRSNCVTDEGWQRFLADHGLSADQVLTYLQHRLRILNFIEERFRGGIRIDDEAIASYYHDQLLPLYLPGDHPPTLEAVAPRIHEILLQQQVNALFDDWLANLRRDGEIEVTDPAYLPPATPHEKTEVEP